jgi:hypothetical protein
MRFINHGYHLVKTDFLPEFHAAIYEACSRLETNPGNAILEAVPALHEIYSHPKVRGALISLLGEDFQMNGHRHLHTTPANHLQSQTWHQDGTNVRHHQIRTVLAMYYPQEVTLENGPTVILPGSHFRNAPTDRMASYANIRGQKFVTVKVGTVAITHYDIWHAGTLNRSNKPRHMLKFLFDRVSEPTRPSWNHDSLQGEAVAQSLVGEMVGPSRYYNSDYYKEWELRKEMWDWLMGRNTEVPAGAFKEMLSGKSR